jgi:hypothetical protein
LRQSFHGFDADVVRVFFQLVAFAAAGFGSGEVDFALEFVFAVVELFFFGGQVALALFQGGELLLFVAPVALDLIDPRFQPGDLLRERKFRVGVLAQALHRGFRRHVGFRFG